jgi:hypothetical protein
MVYNKEKMISENRKEYFIDLLSLVGAAYYKDQKVVMYFQNDDANDPTIIHLMRRAVRKTGYSIRSIERRFDDDDELIQIEFHTDIPEELWDESRRMYNEWVGQVGLD